MTSVDIANLLTDPAVATRPSVATADRLQSPLADELLPQQPRLA